MGKPRAFEFLTATGKLGGGSVTLAVVCFGITAWEHYKDHNVYASVFGFLTIVFFCFGAYWAWSEERESREIIERKYFDERPVLGIDPHSLEGPKAWATSGSPVAFTIQLLKGRIPTSIRFDPIPSKQGKFSLQFDSIPHLESSSHERPMIFDIDTVGAVKLDAKSREATRYTLMSVLALFIGDSLQGNNPIHYELTARFRDNGDERTQSFQLNFEPDRYRFTVMPL